MTKKNILDIEEIQSNAPNASDLDAVVTPKKKYSLTKTWKNYKIWKWDD